MGQRGMTMLELLIAMSVLAIGMGGMLAVFTAAIASNSKAKSDTSGTMLAQTVMERIAAQPATPGGGNILIQDCNPAGPVTWTIAIAPGGANLLAQNNGQGSVNSVDWSQTYANTPANYKMQFVACGNNGRQVTFDVRWNVQTISANSRLITVSARPITADAGNRNRLMYAQPVTLRTIGGV